ncbi:MAG: hypothetical protein RIT15_564 [Pseudomonadota bacterium]
MTYHRSLKTYIGLLTAALAISGSALLVVDSAAAQPAPPSQMDPARMEKMLEHHVERMAKTVNATPEQKTKLMAIAKAAQADVKPLNEQIRSRMDQALAESKEVLTPEQRTQLDAKMKSMRDRMSKRMERHD